MKALTNIQLEGLLLFPKTSQTGRTVRQVLERVLWIVWTGAQWYDLPDRFPSCQTGYRRF
ncbi:transposase [Endozoicomonas elysicola]|uniref:transposase n=1 Tax=Endozoicomonas elysicola TaxID=305900 RepID=UPI0013629D0B